MSGEGDRVSLCSLSAGDGLFGIDTCRIREVLGKRQIQQVPLAPPCIGGIVPYRGEVLTTVSFRAVLGLSPAQSESCILILDCLESGSRFGLMVDRVGGVVTFERGLFTPNPPTLDPVSRALFRGSYRLPGGLLVQLDPDRLDPERLGGRPLTHEARERQEEN